MRLPIKLSPDQLPELSAFSAEAWRRFPDHEGPDQPPARPDQDALADNPLKALRRYRQLGSVHILWRDLMGKADIAETGRAISQLARDCLEMALATAEHTVAAQHGPLIDPHGRPIRLAVLGLGKFGGDELNFNSDIDLVFAWSGHKARSEGPRRLDAVEWLKRVARELIRLLDTVTEDGRVWIVDTRLRPFGDSGALVWSVDAMEQYFLNEGRTWERYAWLKAAPVAGDLEQGQRLIDALQPFVYRRYLDYGIFDSLRDLHQQIDASSRAKSSRDDIKRGAGGIRELEFLIQSQQILRGGRDPDLRQTGFLPALDACRKADLIEADHAQALGTAYGYLRLLENRLQAMTARQGHHLPESPEAMSKLGQLMGERSPEALLDTLNAHRQRVRQAFSEHFEAPEQASVQRQDLWPPTENSHQRLAELGFSDAEAVAERLHTLARRTTQRAISAEGRRRLERLMPQLLDEIARHDQADIGLDDLLRLIEQICRRSAYLALLHERPQTLKRLVGVFRSSARIAEWIVQAPQLLDDLLGSEHDLDLPTQPRLDGLDTEGALYALGRWRQGAFLRTALAELGGQLEARAAAERLSQVAEKLLAQVLSLISENEPDLTIIGYGNLGAGLLHYQSDLDLVFLHGPGKAPIRTAQRVISFMQMPLPGGRLFEVDTRLRPNGNAGMLVSSLEAFAEYQHQQAWTWEHQALIRARWVAGNPDLKAPFEETREAILQQPRNRDEVCLALAEMRQRQLRERPETPIKRATTDLQFVAEAGILSLAHQHDGLARHRRLDRQLKALADAGWLESEKAEGLVAVWQGLLKQRHRDWLARRPDPDLPEDCRDQVAGAWSRCFGE
ncbi:MAG: bifunctional [glutamate--ammonia ligase]-adenylyl-L-tyrosine phosphorylase/[glutamate--ammonia-ligase] adenylyltransferase [Wenzhouxiangella sp.]